MGLRALYQDLKGPKNPLREWLIPHLSPEGSWFEAGYQWAFANSFAPWVVPSFSTLLVFHDPEVSFSPEGDQEEWKAALRTLHELRLFPGLIAYAQGQGNAQWEKTLLIWTILFQERCREEGDKGRLQEAVGQLVSLLSWERNYPLARRLSVRQGSLSSWDIYHEDMRDIGQVEQEWLALDQSLQGLMNQYLAGQISFVEFTARERELGKQCEKFAASCRSHPGLRDIFYSSDGQYYLNETPLALANADTIPVDKIPYECLAGLDRTTRKSHHLRARAECRRSLAALPEDHPVRRCYAVIVRTFLRSQALSHQWLYMSHVSEWLRASSPGEFLEKFNGLIEDGHRLTVRIRSSLLQPNDRERLRNFVEEAWRLNRRLEAINQFLRDRPLRRPYWRLHFHWRLSQIRGLIGRQERDRDSLGQRFQQIRSSFLAAFRNLLDEYLTVLSAAVLKPEQGPPIKPRVAAIDLMGLREKLDGARGEHKAFMVGEAHLNMRFQTGNLTYDLSRLPRATLQSLIEISECFVALESDSVDYRVWHAALLERAGDHEAAWALFQEAYRQAQESVFIRERLRELSRVRPRS